jgi:ssDNA-binding Zn-finger/Zn-ribbon topoisomerase 1
MAQRWADESVIALPRPEEEEKAAGDETVLGGDLHVRGEGASCTVMCDEGMQHCARSAQNDNSSAHALEAVHVAEGTRMHAGGGYKTSYMVAGAGDDPGHDDAETDPMKAELEGERRETAWRPEEFKRGWSYGDWTCSRCRFLVFSWREQCPRCGHWWSDEEENEDEDEHDKAKTTDEELKQEVDQANARVALVYASTIRMVKRLHERIEAVEKEIGTKTKRCQAWQS